MIDNTTTGDARRFERINPSCLAFHVNRLFISDNLFLYVPPNDSFCRSCFSRRYQCKTLGGISTDRIGDAALNLAGRLDRSLPEAPDWRVFSIQGQSLAMRFDLVPYEDCPQCGDFGLTERDQARTAYAQLLTADTVPDIEGLRKQLFSFGYARGEVVTREAGLGNPALDALMGDNYAAIINFRIMDPYGNYMDSTTLGASPNRQLARLKALMEYLERYAFFLKLCHLRTNEYDDDIIDTCLSLYEPTVSPEKKNSLRRNAFWGVDLATREVRPIPAAFIFNHRTIDFIRPTSNGFGAHTSFRESLSTSIIELAERDAFVRFWYEPSRGHVFEPDSCVRADVSSIISTLGSFLENETLVSRFFVVESPIRLPVVLATISNRDISRPPSLCFGFASGYTLADAVNGAIEELRFNTLNLTKAVSMFNGFIDRKFTDKIENLQDRMQFYATSAPRSRLRFLDESVPPPEGLVEEVQEPGLDTLISRFVKAGLDIYGIDCTPAGFSGRNVYVTRAFSPHLYPLQFQHENVFNLNRGPLSAQGELPHFFL